MLTNCKIMGVGVEPEAYHAQPPDVKRGDKEFCMSPSQINLFRSHSPSWWVNGGELPDSKSLRYGSLLDTLVLQPSFFARRYILQPSEYEHEVLKCPKCGSVTDSPTCRKCKVDRVKDIESRPWSNQSDSCKEWVETQENAGRTVVTKEEVAMAQTARDRIHADPKIKRLLQNSDFQVWIRGEWHDPETGLVIPVQCLADIVGTESGPCASIAGDLKSTKNAAVGPWASWARKVGYDVQGAFNLDMIKAATKRDLRSFCFVLSESSAPFEIGRRYMEEDYLAPEQSSLYPGRSKYKQALELYCKCLKSGKWPGYDDTDEASLSGWTLLPADDWDEQRRMFAPKFVTDSEPEEDAPEDDGEITP